MKKVVALVIFLFLISIIYVNAVEVIEKDIADYTFYRSYNHTPGLFIPIQKLTYIDNSTGLQYKVQVIEFNKEAEGITFDSEYLDAWITDKTKRSSDTLTINENIVFINEYNNIVLWRSGDIYVQVTDGRKKTTSAQELVESLSKEGQGGFPTDIIKAYLEIYPSDCNTNHCTLHDEEIKERQRLLNETLNAVNEQLIEKRRLMREESRNQVIAPSEIRKNTTKTVKKSDEQIELPNGPDIVTISGHEGDEEPESEKNLESKENLLERLINWIKITFPNFLR